MELNVDHAISRFAESHEDIPHQFFDCLKVRGIEWKGRKVAEIGSGTGSLTRKLYKRGADVIGVEPSNELREAAKKIESRHYIEIPYLKGSAEATNLPDQYYDMVTVHRSWHWFDRPKALGEIKRILKEKGTLIVSDSMVIPDQQIVKDTMTFMKEFVEIKPPGSKGDSKNLVNGIPVEWLLEWQETDFTIKDFFTFYYTVDFTIESWCQKAGSLSWMTPLETGKREEIIRALEDFLSKQYHTINNFSLKHQFSVCVMNK